jgi:acetolactate synthase-1/2/3 large subunit
MQAAQRIVAATGCRLMSETFPARVDGGVRHPVVERFPYLAEMATATLARCASIVLAGATSPVAFFAKDGVPSQPVPTSLQQATLAGANENVTAALEALADELGAGAHPGAPRPPLPSVTGTALTPRNALAILAAVQPEGAIIVDEGVSAGGVHFGLSAACPPFSYLSLTGGATGYGLPCAVGAAIACPDRPVIVIEGDGSAMYSVQALWTMARQGLHVITLILANDRYRILELELEREFGTPTASAQQVTDFSSPPLRWTTLASSLGVSAQQVTTTVELRAALSTALAERRPYLIEVRIAASATGPAAGRTVP